MILTFEGHDSTLEVLLFKEVENSKEIRELVVKGAVDPEFAFINAAAVVGALHLRLAGHKALTRSARGRLAARSLHAELVFSLSGSKHIGESLKRFGVQDDTRSLLVARFDASPADLEYVRGLVRGTEVKDAPLEEALAGGGGDASRAFKVTPEELSIGGLEEAVACRVAVRDCV